MPYRSKRYRKDAERATEQALPLADAIKRLKTFSKTRFDQSVDLVCHLGIDANQADQAVRGSFSFPRGIGKSKKVIAFCPDGDVAAAKAAGAVEAGNDDLVDKVNKGWTDFDVAISHPSLMGKVGRLGKVLGPQGKMPSPKAGTVTADVATAVKEFAAGRIEFRNDKGGNIHVPVGRFSFSDDDLQTNIAAFIEQIRRVKPAAAKGAYLRKVVISGTMTPGVQIDVAAHAE
ncbi:MAG: 50S ribosomal protein L1 [Planctomycetia bacterium]|nr:MAG: 50S ribosomal protein L1 [Planctomycetia bacterium]